MCVCTIHNNMLRIRFIWTSFDEIFYERYERYQQSYADHYISNLIFMDDKPDSYENAYRLTNQNNLLYMYDFKDMNALFTL